MKTDLMRSLLEKNHLAVYVRGDELLCDLSNIVMNFPRHILAADSISYVRSLTGRLALMIPEVHRELWSIGDMWEDFIWRREQIKAVRDAVKLIARLKRTHKAPDEQRLLRCVSQFLHIIDGEHHYMDAMLLYLTEMVRREWKKHGEKALGEKAQAALIREVTDRLWVTRSEMKLVRRSSFSPYIITREYNTEMLNILKLRHNAEVQVRAAEKAVRKEMDQESPLLKEKAARDSLRKTREFVSIAKGRAVASQLAPENVGSFLSFIRGRLTEKALSDARELLVKRLLEIAPWADRDIEFLVSQHRLWSEHRMTLANLRRRCASFMIAILRKEDIPVIYTAEALCLSLTTKDPEDLRFIFDTYLVPWCGSSVKIKEKIQGMMRILRSDGSYLLPTDEQYTTI